MHAEKRGCTQVIRTWEPVWWWSLTRVQTANLVESFKFLGGIPTAAGALNEGIVSSSWEDQGGCPGRGGIGNEP